MSETLLRRSRGLGDLFSVSLSVLREYFNVYVQSALRVAGPVYAVYFALLVGSTFLFAQVAGGFGDTLMNQAVMMPDIGYLIQNYVSMMLAAWPFFATSAAIGFVGLCAQWFFIATTVSSSNSIGAYYGEIDVNRVVEYTTNSKWSIVLNFFALYCLLAIGSFVFVAINIIVFKAMSPFTLVLSIPISITLMVVLYVRFCSLLYPILVLERINLVQAIRRNAYLTEGNTLRFIGYGIVIGLVAFAFGIALGIPVLIFGSEIMSMQQSVLMQAVFTIIGVVVELILLAFLTVFETYTYGAVLDEKGEVDETDWSDDAEEWETV